MIVDGINEQGLFVSGLYFPGYAGYATATPDNSSRAMASYEFGNWLLGNFATVDEVRAQLRISCWFDRRSTLRRVPPRYTSSFSTDPASRW